VPADGVVVQQLPRLRQDTGDELVQEAVAERHDVVDALTGDGAEHALAQGGRPLVTGAAQDEGHGVGGVVQQVARWHVPGPEGGHGEREHRRAPDEGPVEVEEGGSAELGHGSTLEDDARRVIVVRSGREWPGFILAG
jgi:hypothetical protein